MIDPNFIYENEELVKRKFAEKGYDFDFKYFSRVYTGRKKVIQDLEEFNPEEKLKKDEEKGINIETMSLSGNDDSDFDLDDFFEPIDFLINLSALVTNFIINW